MSLVSVVVPAFNQARFVAQAVNSVLDQSHPWVEVIVVDDGSTDETAEVLRQFEGSGKVTIVRQPNAGLPAARNRGLRESRGEFVCFLDSDDYLAPTYLERLLAPFAEDPSLGFAYCDVQMVDLDGRHADAFSVGRSRRVVSGDIFESLLVGGYFPPHSVLVRREVLEDVGAFDTGLGGHADYEMWLRIAAVGHRAHYVDARLALYRVYAGSMSRNRQHMRATRIKALERIARDFPERTAKGLSSVQELAVDLHQANAWLRERWDSTLVHLVESEPVTAWSLLANSDGAQLTSGAADQLGLWDLREGDTSSRCLYLHPPATLRTVIPTGDAGRLTAVIGLHPDVWTRADADGCIFVITVDSSVVASVLLDPSRRESDRRWLTLSLEIPTSATREHVVTLETQAPGTGFYVWALFKDVYFERTRKALGKAA